MRSPAFWWQPHLTLPALLLWPLGAVYGHLANWHGQSRAKRAYFASVPVISVGNITVGGSGKTPLVQKLAAHYALSGQQVAVVLRGYGGTESADPLQVTFQHSATQVGDEAVALFRALPRGVQVWVGHHRPSVVRRAEAAGAGLIILDDGFQRRDVARQADLLILNGHPPPGQADPLPFGNGLCLPAGPLREPLANRSRATWAVVMNEPARPVGQPMPYYGLMSYRLRSAPTPASLAALQGKPLLAFAGLGHPEKFFDALRQAGLTLAMTVALPDHTRYRPAQLQALQHEAKTLGATLVTTTKDAAKLPAGFAQVVEADVTGPDWENLLEGLAIRLQEAATAA